MSRRQRRMLRRARGQAVLKTVLLMAAAMMVIAGLFSHLPGNGTFQAEMMAQPTATPLTTAFDETVTTREITLAQEVWYAIQTGVYSTQEAAQGRADAYADRGAPGYVAHDGGKWRVLIACYGEKADADAVRERLSAMQQVETHLHTWDAPAVSMRLSGMNGQLDVAQTGLNLPLQAAGQLRDAAIALDAGESNVESVLMTVQALNESLILWEKTAKERFAVPYPAMIASVLDFTSAWPAMYSMIRKAENATELSAQMKKQAMAAYDALVQMRTMLIGQ